MQCTKARPLHTVVHTIVRSIPRHGPRADLERYRLAFRYLASQYGSRRVYRHRNRLAIAVLNAR